MTGLAQNDTTARRRELPGPLRFVPAHFLPVLAGAALFLVTIIAYLPALQCGFIWDDNDYVTENKTLRSVDGLKQIWLETRATPQYYPMVHTTFWLEYRAWESSPAGYHLTNILLHALAAVLLWRVLARLNLAPAWLAAAFFALHPVAVESVAWITERKNVLSGVFYFAAALACLRFNDASDPRVAGWRRWGWYGGACALFVAALLSKTVTCSLPAALLLVQWWKKGCLRRSDVVPLIPFFALGVALGLLTIWLENHQVGARGEAWALTFPERLIVAGHALWFYLGKLLWPVDLTFIYPRWQISASVWWQWLPSAVAIVDVVVLWLVRARIGRGPLTALLFFGGTLFPALGFINVFPMRYSFVADHFQYLACVGVMVPAAVVLRRLPWPGLAVVLIVLGGLTWRQTHIYRDLETLWHDTLTKNPTCWLAYNNLGVLRERQGKPSEAEAFFRKAVELNPGFAEAVSSLGANLAGQGKVDEAMDCFRRALKIEPGYANAMYNLGKALNLRAQYGEAIPLFESALRFKADDHESRRGLAEALLMQGRREEAITQYRLLLDQTPNDANARYQLGLALALDGKLEEAVEQYTRTLQLMPGSAEVEYNLGYALRRLGRLDQAKHHLQAAIRLKPGFPIAHYNLGCLLVEQGEREEAIRHLREAIRLQPDYADAQKKLRDMGVSDAD